MFSLPSRDQKSAVWSTLAGLDLPPETEAKLLEYLNENPRHAQGKVIYDLEGVFGVDVDALRKRFAFYYERFPIQQEK